jgi:transcriptional regulator with XRE-family HTH domain
MDKQGKADCHCHFLAGNIKLLRKRKKLSQEELGQQLGLNRGNIASYENGSAEPRICNLLRMASFFGVSIIDLAQRDLQQEENLASLVRIHGLCPQERAKLEGLYQQGLAFQQFLKGIHTCYSYRTNDLQQINELPKEAAFFQSHFEQLHEAAKRIATEHLELLRMCRTKEEE